MYARFVEDRIRAALADTPVVMLNGPRQSGKTTLARAIAGNDYVYRTLDDPDVLDSARSDPVGFVRTLDRGVIDEVQRAPDLLLAIKAAIDRQRDPGRFLLTGSADIMTLPTVSDSLAGRMEVVVLHPLSRSEIIGRRPSFIDTIFKGSVPKPAEKLIADGLVAAVLAGGYPEAVARRDPDRRRRWHLSYIEALVRRDVRDIADVHKLQEIPSLMRVLAEYSARLPNFTDIGGKLQLDYRTLQRYLGVLEQLFVVTRLQAWSRHELKRLVKTPKAHFLDSGLLASLRGETLERLTERRDRLGSLLETFVLTEIVRQSSWSDARIGLYHYRDKDLNEVDIVLDDDRGRIAGVEVKAAATATSSDFRGLRRLAAATGKSFRAGVVLYDGEAVLPFGDRLFAAPFASLWS